MDAGRFADTTKSLASEEQPRTSSSTVDLIRDLFAKKMARDGRNRRGPRVFPSIKTLYCGADQTDCLVGTLVNALVAVSARSTN